MIKIERIANTFNIAICKIKGKTLFEIVLWKIIKIVKDYISKSKENQQNNNSMLNRHSLAPDLVDLVDIAS